MTPVTLATVAEPTLSTPARDMDMPVGSGKPFGSMPNTPPRAVPGGRVCARLKVAPLPATRTGTTGRQIEIPAPGGGGGGGGGGGAGTGGGLGGVGAGGAGAGGAGGVGAGGVGAGGSGAGPPLVGGGSAASSEPPPQPAPMTSAPARPQFKTNRRFGSKCIQRAPATLFNALQARNLDPPTASAQQSTTHVRGVASPPDFRPCDQGLDSGMVTKPFRRTSTMKRAKSGPSLRRGRRAREQSDARCTSAGG